ncbi:MAG: acyltransferase family protein [Streptosporangiaceae bacterium]
MSPAPQAAARHAYLDLLRVLAISAVVTGHWLLTSVTDYGGRLSGVDAMHYVSWSGWVTLAFQVMPTFFLVGGYVDAISWTRHHERGESWLSWVRGRAMRLLWPTAVYAAAATAALGGARAAGTSPGQLALIGWVIAFQLWFLPVYLLLIALTPALLAAHRRWGVRLPLAMTAAAGAVDAVILGAHLTAVGYANYLLVWGSMYVWGFAWRDGTLSSPRWRPYALAAAGAAALAALLAWSPFPVDMIGAGEHPGNTTPPSVALLAYAAAQAGLVIAAEPLARRLLGRPRRERIVTRLNSGVMIAYLWHMVPVVLIGATLYPAGVLPEVVPGTALWWQTRPAWLAALWVTLLALIAVLTWALRPLRLLPSGLGPVRARSPVQLAIGLALTTYALTRLAIGGFAPAGVLPAGVLIIFAAGMGMVLTSGRQPGAAQHPVAARPGGRPRPQPAGTSDVSASARGS